MQSVEVTLGGDTKGRRGVASCTCSQSAERKVEFDRNVTFKTASKWTGYALMIWWLIFFATKFYADGDSAGVESGNSSRQALVLLFALFGLCYLPLGLKRLRGALGPWVLFGFL